MKYVQDLLKKFLNPTLEWVKCSVKDVKTVITEIKTGQKFSNDRHESFQMRDEQTKAVNKTYNYFQSIWKEDKNSAPRFLWNEMRFAKHFLHINRKEIRI